MSILPWHCFISSYHEVLTRAQRMLLLALAITGCSSRGPGQKARSVDVGGQLILNSGNEEIVNLGMPSSPWHWSKLSDYSVCATCKQSQLHNCELAPVSCDSSHQTALRPCKWWRQYDYKTIACWVAFFFHQHFHQLKLSEESAKTLLFSVISFEVI